MFHEFDDRARAAVLGSERLAVSLGFTRIAPEHLLVASLQQRPDSVSALVLQRNDMNADKLIVFLTSRNRRSKRMARKRLHFTSSTKDAMMQASLRAGRNGRARVTVDDLVCSTLAFCDDETYLYLRSTGIRPGLVEADIADATYYSKVPPTSAVARYDELLTDEQPVIPRRSRPRDIIARRLSSLDSEPLERLVHRIRVVRSLCGGRNRSSH
jgi:hypothetical protein